MIVIVVRTTLFLGEGATARDRERYMEHLATHLARAFGRDVEVEEANSDQTTVECDADALRDQVADYVRDVEASDLWVDLAFRRGARLDVADRARRALRAREEVRS